MGDTNTHPGQKLHTHVQSSIVRNVYTIEPVNDKNVDLANKQFQQSHLIGQETFDEC